MKYFTIFALTICVPAAVLAMFDEKKLNTYLHQNEEDCTKKTGVNPVDIEDVRRSGIVPENEQMNEFAKCILQKFNVIDSNGKINQDVTSYDIPSDTPDWLFSAAEKCTAESGLNDADTARKVMNCLIEEDQIILASKPRSS